MPLAVHLGVEVVADSAETVVCRLRIGHVHLNQSLVGHGGVLFALADTALGLLANRPGDRDVWVGTAFNLHLYRPVRVGDEVDATASLEHRGRRLTACRVEIRMRGDGALIGVLTNELLPVPTAAQPGRPDAVLRALQADDPLAVALLASAARHARGTDDAGLSHATEENATVLGLFVDDQPMGVAALEPRGVDSALLRHAWLVTGDRDQQLERSLVESVLRFVREAGMRELAVGRAVAESVVAAFARHCHDERPVAGPDEETRLRL